MINYPKVVICKELGILFRSRSRFLERDQCLLDSIDLDLDYNLDPISRRNIESNLDLEPSNSDTQSLGMYRSKLRARIPPGVAISMIDFQ